jgi:hypothetical protein
MHQKLTCASCVCCSSSSGIDHTASCNAHTTICCGSLLASDYTTFLGLVDSIIDKKERDTKENNQKGFQRTPAFIEAVVLDALVELHQPGMQGGHEPRGGTTDVGQHTGGIPRDTSWPLVQQTFLVGIHYVSYEVAPQCYIVLPAPDIIEYYSMILLLIVSN